MRSPDPAAAARAFVAAGRDPDRPAADARAAVRQDLRRHRRRRRPRRRPRRRRRDRAQLRPGHAARAVARRGRRARAARPRRGAGGRPAPRIVLVTADLPGRPLRPDRRRRRPRRDPAQRRRAAVRGSRPSAGRPGRRSASRPGDDRRTPSSPLARRATSTPASSGSCSTPPAGRIPAGPGSASTPTLAAAVAREVPVTLAGGLDAGNVADALRAIPAVGVDVASGVERAARRRRAAAQGPAPRRAVRRSAPAPPATTAPTSPFGPTPVHAGPARRRRRRPLGDGARLRRPLRARDADGRARAARGRLRRAPPRPASSGPSCATCSRTSPAARRPLYRADRLAEAVARARRRGSPAAAPRAPRSRALRLYLKREDLAHTGAHKINNALGQALLTRRLGKTRVIAETGAGQHGVATATACALLDLPCVVYMGAEDIERQGPNVLRMRALGAEVRSRHVGHGHAQGRGQRGDARLGDQRRDDPLRPRLGDGPAPVPDDRARPPAPDRRRGGGPAARGRGAAARPRARLRRRRLERDRAARPVHRRAVGPPGGRRGGGRRRSRPAATRRRSWAGRRASSTARAR